jgi:integrase
MSINLRTVSGRSRIAPRRDPYWLKIEGTLHLGWRKMVADGDGHWLARLLDPSSGKRVFKTIGILIEHSESQRFDVAKREAEAWARHVLAGGAVTSKTVADACSAYVAHLDRTKGGSAAEDARKRLERLVLSDKAFAGLELPKLTPAPVRAWRQRLQDRPVFRGTKGGRPSVPTAQSRSAASVNRDMTSLRAALNLALEQGWTTTDFAWRAALKPIDGADGRRNVYLDREQRQNLINASGALGPFVRVLAQLPVRPGALAALTVRDFDARLSQLNIVLDKTGPRAIQLPPQAAALFAAACVSKLPTAPIFSRPDGKVWNKDSWKQIFRRAALAAGLPSEAVLYSLRHSAITDLVISGLDLLTVARISGTSVAMIEKHYGHHRASAATAALAAIAM